MMPPLIAAVEAFITVVTSAATVILLLTVFRHCKKADFRSSPLFWTLMCADFAVAFFHLPHALFWGCYFLNFVGYESHLAVSNDVITWLIQTAVIFYDCCSLSLLIQKVIILLRPGKSTRFIVPACFICTVTVTTVFSVGYAVAFNLLEPQPSQIIKDCFNTNCEIPRGKFSTIFYLDTKLVFVFSDVLLGFLFLALVHRRNIKSFSANFRWSIIFMKYLFLFHFFVVLIPFLLDLVILNTIGVNLGIFLGSYSRVLLTAEGFTCAVIYKLILRRRKTADTTVVEKTIAISTHGRPTKGK